MDKETLVTNIETYCKTKKIKPSPACIAAGLGKNFLTDIKRGQTPSVAKVAALAAYLGVSTSDLVGDARESPEGARLPQDERELLDLYRLMNEEGQERLRDTADDMVRGGKYIKSDADQMGSEKNIG